MLELEDVRLELLVPIDDELEEELEDEESEVELITIELDVVVMTGGVLLPPPPPPQPINNIEVAQNPNSRNRRIIFLCFYRFDLIFIDFI